jgi:hypothetical protein
MVVSWLLFPLVLLVVCLGCGLAVQRLSGWELPGGILASLGLASVIVIATLTTDNATTATWTLPIVLIVAAAGYATGWRRLRARRPDGWMVAAGAAVFAVCAAPVVLSGDASFLGYFVLNDGVFHFSLIDQLLHHGHDITGLTPSSYQAVLNSYLSTSYPTGGDLPIGVVRPLVGQDVAWIFQPYMALVMALGAVGLYELLGTTVKSHPLRATAAGVAAQAGLLYAYYLEGSIKEVATTWVITLTVVLVCAMLRGGVRLRGLIPLAVVTVAGLDLLDLAIAPWLAPPLAVFVVVAGWHARDTVHRMSPRRLAVSGGVAVVLLVAIATPIIQRASTFLHVATAVLTQKGDLGNLVHELPKWEMFGIWPAGDFRLPVVAHYRLTYALIGVGVASAALGVIWALRRRRLAPLLLLGGNAIAAAYLLSRASPYAGAKVMMIFSLTAVATMMLGPAALADAGRRFEAWGLAAVIAAGVLWTNGLAFHDASLAPRPRLAELSAIGQRFSGQGPAFYNLSDEFAAYFLRRIAPIDPALSPPAARPGITAPVGRAPWDPDDLPLSSLESFRLLVIGSGALASRPPANYRLVDAGRFYDVWRRTTSPAVIEHLALGAPGAVAAIPPCRVVRAMAARAAHEQAQLAYVARPPVPTYVPSAVPSPTISGPVTITRPGVYRVAVQGDISPRLDVSVDGRPVGTIADELGPPGQVTPVGSLTLAAGTHSVRIVRPGNILAPGDGGGVALSRVLFVSGPAAPPVSEINPSQASSLCGQELDWIEIVR